MGVTLCGTAQYNPVRAKASKNTSTRVFMGEDLQTDFLQRAKYMPAGKCLKVGRPQNKERDEQPKRGGGHHEAGSRHEHECYGGGMPGQVSREDSKIIWGSR